MFGTSSLRIAHVQPMTLDLFDQRDEDFGAGVMYFIPNIAEAQVMLGHQPTVHLLTSGRASSRNVRGFAVHFHPCLQPPSTAGLQRRFGRQLSLGLLRSLVADETDVVHFYGLRNSQLMLAAVASRCRRLAIPLVAHDQGRRTARGIEAWAWRKALPKVSACVISTAEAADELATAGVAAASAHFVPNGFDPRIFYPGPERPDSPDPFRILVVSRLTEEKDPLTAARAAALLSPELRAELCVAGTGPLDSAVATILNGGSTRLRLLGHVSQRELGDHYRRADVFVLSSLHEGWNQSVLEAMACGVPVVATDVPGLRDAVGDAGVLIPVGDHTSLRDVLVRLHASPEWRRSLRQAGLSRARPLTWSNIARRLDDVYRSVLPTQPPPRRSVNA
ncbi:MAG: glycosyltransferase family 4 protein [Gaiellaceae bacterium]